MWVLVTPSSVFQPLFVGLTSATVVSEYVWQWMSMDRTRADVHLLAYDATNHTVRRVTHRG